MAEDTKGKCAKDVYPFILMAPTNLFPQERSRVFFDIQIGGRSIGRIAFELVSLQHSLLGPI